MGEDSLSKPTTPSIQLNDYNPQNTNTEIDNNEYLMYIVHLKDIHYEDYENNPNDLDINAHDIILVHIFKQYFEEGTNFEQMIKTLLGNVIIFLQMI
jgi:hypothetical protein